MFIHLSVSPSLFQKGREVPEQSYVLLGDSVASCGHLRFILKRRSSSDGRTGPPRGSQRPRQVLRDPDTLPWCLLTILSAQGMYFPIVKPALNLQQTWWESRRSVCWCHLPLHPLLFHPGGKQSLSLPTQCSGSFCSLRMGSQRVKRSDLQVPGVLSDLLGVPWNQHSELILFGSEAKPGRGTLRQWHLLKSYVSSWQT